MELFFRVMIYAKQGMTFWWQIVPGRATIKVDLFVGSILEIKWSKTMLHVPGYLRGIEAIQRTHWAICSVHDCIEQITIVLWFQAEMDKI